MMITFTEAARLAGVSKGAIRKAALETQKLRAEKDDQGVWRIDAADVQRLWPQRPALDTVTTPQSSPVSVSNQSQQALAAKLEAAEQWIADKDATIADLRRRLNESETERRQAQERLTALLTDQRPAPQPAERRGWWPWRRGK
jgi:hypothetical protein